MKYGSLPLFYGVRCPLLKMPRSLDCHNEQRATDWIPAFAGMTIVVIGPGHPRAGGDPEKTQLQDMLRLKY